ncbi:restriction endonuclease subunit S [Rhizobium sp. 9T]|uniref:restriction endonuclease subunit S n=1 Tax=Rhizobium croatiense TaxID=2867516 RepID=UPI001C931B5B|nr:restriction endonuclease subunit S [Rhizobium croatiense]MBY4609825.1 restriction endonuclease subunit S [Rhizobium croatiense]
MSFQALGEAVDIVAGQHIEASLYSSEPIGSAYLTGPADFGETRPRVTKWTSAPKVFAKASDVLVTVKGAGVGKSNLGCDAAIGRQLMALRPKQEKVLQSYLFHFIRYKEQRIAGLADGATVPGIGKADLANLQIPLPPIGEQKRIAAILDKADQLRQKRRQAIELLNSLTQSIFLEMFGDCKRWSVSSFGALAAEAKIGLVRSAAEIGENFNIPYLRMDGITSDGRLNLSSVKKTHATASEIQTYQLIAGDFLFNTRNSKELVGKTTVYTGPSGYIYNNNILRVRFTEAVNSIYVAAYFRTDEGRRDLEARKSGTTSVFAIYQKNLESMLIPLPPIEMQNRFAERITKISFLRNSLISSQDAISGFFSSLQHRAFTGGL